jgi:uncharacterized protein (TIGR02118 family)
MVQLTVLYGHPDDPDAFEEYYANTHMPLVDKMPNLKRYEAAGAVLDASAVLAYLRLRVADCRLRREQIRSLKSVIDNRQVVVGW